MLLLLFFLNYFTCYFLIDDEKKVVNTREIGILQYLGLDDWKIALPVAMCFAPPLIHHEVSFETFIAVKVCMCVLC